MKVKFFLRIPPPLRLADQDVQMYSNAVKEWLDKNAQPRVLVMGATSEFFPCHGLKRPIYWPLTGQS